MRTTGSDSAETRRLLAAAQAGDERAFWQLVGPYRRALEVHSYRMLGSPHDAEDVVQEALLRAWKGIGGFEPRAQIQTWLYRIATNASLDEIARRPRRPEPVAPFPDAMVEQAAAPVYDPAARYAIREGMELALLAAIQLLPGRQRAVLILRDVLGWSAPEVAELLGSSVASVTSALQRARATLDAHMPAREPDSAGAGSEVSDSDERALLADYVTAWEQDDVERLVSLLREDALLRMPPQPTLHGARKIVEFFRRVAPDGSLTQMRVAVAYANGRPVLVLHKRTPDGTLEPHGVLMLELSGREIAAFDAFIEPALADMFSRAGVA